MSLLTQRTCFSSGTRSFILETDPGVMDSIEKIAIILGGKKLVRSEIHDIVFDSSSAKSNEQSLSLIEMIYSKIPQYNVNKLEIYYQNQSLILEGDDEKLKVLISLINVFGKEVSSSKVIFSDCEKIAFNTICYIATKLGIIPV